MKKDTKNWRELPSNEWNVTTITSFLADVIEERFGVTYQPGGGGSKNQRWMREKGMMKQAQTKYGTDVIREFIELCASNYHAKPEYPYPTFTFMYSYMDRYLAEAQANVKKAEERQAREASRKELTEAEIQDLL